MINVKIEEFFIASWKQIGLIISDMREHLFLWSLFIFILLFILNFTRQFILENIRRAGYKDRSERKKNAEDIIEKLKELNYGLKDLNNNIENKINNSNETLSFIEKTLLDIQLINNITFFMNADKKSVITKVNRNGSSLEYASEEMRADKEVVMAAVLNDGMALCYASEELKADKEVVLKAVGRDGNALQYASEEMRADKEVVIKAVRFGGRVLYYASEELKADKEVVLKAVGRDGNALEYASKSLRADKEVVITGLKADQHGIKCIYYIANVLFNDIDVLFRILNHDYYNDRLRVHILPEKLQEKLENKFLFLDLVKRNGYLLKFASNDLRKDKEVVFEAVKNNIKALKYASYNLNTISYTIELIDAGIKVGDENYQFKNGKDIVLKYEELKQKNSWLSPIYRSYILWKYK